jgi:hypothetical protein
VLGAESPKHFRAFPPGLRVFSISGREKPPAGFSRGCFPSVRFPPVLPRPAGRRKTLPAVFLWKKEGQTFVITSEKQSRKKMQKVVK